MKKIFAINIKIVLLIIIFSSITGIIFNTLNTKGISVFENPKKINWAEDQQLLKDSTSNPNQKKVILKNDTLGTDNLVKIESQNTDKKEIKPEKISVILSPKAVNLKQAYSLFKSNNATFIDTRDQWDYRDGHIKGSLNIPYYKFNTNDETLKKIKKSQLIITYCDGDDCEMSKKLAQQLLRLGYGNVYFFFGGWGEWNKANYPIEKSENL